MKITKQARRDAKRLFKSCVANGVLDENRVRQAVSAVITRRPRGYAAILNQFEKLVRLETDRNTARIESPAPLAPEALAALQANLSRHHGAGLKFETAANPALLGGLRIKVGSDVYDSSVRARLAALQEALSQ